MNNNFLIIAGTEKAGTTSLYQYLCDSGLFVPSVKKETDYLRKPFDQTSLEGYVENFDAPSGSNVYLESSPGYLADSGVVVKNITKLGLQNSSFIFLLRSPLSRLKSSFLFHKSRLYIPKNLSFNEYIETCLKYEQGMEPTDSGLDEWFLRVPDAGLYYKHLLDFLNADINDLMIIPFEDFSRDPKKCVNAVIERVGMQTDFFNDYDFSTSNVTKGFRFSLLQSFALRVNKELESFFYRYPSVKRNLLPLYGLLNGAPKENVHVGIELKAVLRNYYLDDLMSLKRNKIISKEVVRAWLNEFEDD